MKESQRQLLSGLRREHSLKEREVFFKVSSTQEAWLRRVSIEKELVEDELRFNLSAGGQLPDFEAKAYERQNYELQRLISKYETEKAEHNRLLAALKK